jgi:predicted nucleic acid-binding protein
LSTIPPPTFDKSRLPLRAAVDTVFLIRALEDPGQDSGVSMALWVELLRNQLTVLVPAPVLAEFQIAAKVPVPKTPRVQVVAFDEPAALSFASIGNKALRTVQDQGFNRYVVRNDAMVVATAKRHLADALLTGDGRADMVAMCKLLGLPLIDPQSLVVSQHGPLFSSAQPTPAAPVTPPTSAFGRVIDLGDDDEGGPGSSEQTS